MPGRYRLRKSRSRSEANNIENYVECPESNSSYDCSYTAVLDVSNEEDFDASKDTDLWKTACEDRNSFTAHTDHDSSDENMRISDRGLDSSASSSEDEERNSSGDSDEKNKDDEATNSYSKRNSRFIKQSTPKSNSTPKSHSTPKSSSRNNQPEGIVKKKSRNVESFCSIENNASNIRSFLEPTEGVMVLVMPVPSEIAFYGQAQIRAISGCVDICGFEIPASEPRFYPIYSAKSIFSFPIKAKSYELMSSQHQEDMRNCLKNFFQEHKISKILGCCKYSSAVVILKQFRVTHAIDFVNFYHPNIFNPSNVDKETNLMQKFRKFHFTVGGMKSSFNEPHTYSSLGEAIVKEIQGRGLNSKSNNSGSCVMVYGPQAVGKSSLLRYLINKVLSVCPSVMYLDLDPGQTEFTPPACLSLTEVKEPLLGPPFTHEKSPVMQVFYGSVSVLPSGYFNACVKNLHSFYMREYRHIPLFVNMFGWMEDLGKEYLDFAKEVVKPTFEVMLENNDCNDPLHISPIPDLSDPDKTKIILKSAKNLSVKVKKNARKSASLRELMVLAYLGRCQPYFDAPTYLNSFKPYKVKVKDVVIHLMHCDGDPPLLIKALNSAFVALCIVKDDNILVCAEQHCECPKILKDPYQLGDCVGFGFVRAIDETNGVLYFISPEPPQKLYKVNAFVKGNVTTPSLIKNQGIYGVPLPYSTHRTPNSKTET